MANYIPENLIQKFLTLSADIVATNFGRLAADPIPDGITKLVPGTSAADFINLSVADASNLTRKEQELFSTVPVVNDTSSLEVFALSQSAENPIPWEYTYDIRHDLTMFLSGADTTGNELFTFNIDEANNDINDNNGRFFFDKIEIKNKAKDTFTAKSNYVVTITVGFTTIDDILGEHLTVKKVSDPTITKQISVMQLLYKFFNARGTAPGAIKSLADQDGIYLRQILKLDPLDKGTLYTKTKSYFIKDELHKIFHLLYYKHSFDMFIDNEPIVGKFPNKLTLSYVAYDADAIAKPLADGRTPRPTDNVYEYLDKLTSTELNKIKTVVSSAKAYRDFLLELRNQMEQIRTLQVNSQCKSLYEEARAAGRAVSSPVSSIDSLNLETAKSDLKTKGENLKKLRGEINESLFFALLNSTPIYEIKIKNSELNVFYENRFIEGLKKHFGWDTLFATLAAATTGFTLGTSVGGVIGTFTVPVLGTAIGAGTLGIIGASVGAASVIGSAIYKSITEQFVTQDDITVSQVRAAASSATFVEYIPDPKNYFDRFGSAITAKKDISEEELLKFLLKEGSEEEKKKLGLGNNVEVPKKDETDTKQSYYLVFFGDILKVLNILNPNNLQIVVGGKNVLLDASGASNFLNYYDFPIHYNSYVKFLTRFILGRTDTRLSSELFFKEVYEQLIRNAVTDEKNEIADAYRIFIPSVLKVNSSVHFQTSDYTNKIYNRKTLNLQNQFDFEEYKKAFLTSKSSRNSFNSGTPLSKIFIISSCEPLKFVDFYQEYNDSLRVGTSFGRGTNDFYHKQFQEFINEKYLMPCITLENTPTRETILKNKFIKFSRKDNPNLVTGNILENLPIIRLPYQFNGDLRAIMTFFVDIGSLIFVAPPEMNTDVFNPPRNSQSINPFGFGGLYLVIDSLFEYSFQRITSNNSLSLPNFDSKCNIIGTMVSFGDSVRPPITGRPDEFCLDTTTGSGLRRSRVEEDMNSFY